MIKTARYNGKEGFEAICHVCTKRSFFPSRKRLPDQVVSKKFRQGGWEVNQNGKDVCPKCIKERSERVTPENRVYAAAPEELPLNASNVTRVISTCGVPAPQVVELEHKSCRKFEIKFLGHAEVQFGQLLHAEGEVLRIFNTKRKSSYIRAKLEHTEDTSSMKLNTGLSWFLTLEPNLPA
jgi:hypothetical protein